MDRSPLRLALLLILLVFACFALSPQSQSANTPNTPDPGPLPISNTADGDLTLVGVTGIYNSAFGFYALLSNDAASFNTGVGAGALLSNTGDENTAVGAAALFSNTTAANNTAVGAFALFSNTAATATFNTAIGEKALFSNTTGSLNTAVGTEALFSNNQIENTATGAQALKSNTTGCCNTANGAYTLTDNVSGSSNTAEGDAALTHNTLGAGNTAIGRDALHDATGSSNVALGAEAGTNLTTGDNNIDIGNPGVAAEANTIRVGTVGTQTAAFIAGISETAVVGDPVVVDANGQLGTATSSARFKKDIKPMDKTSEAILSLKPVSFHYKSDGNGTPQFGLIAEEVAKVNPDLVVRDRNGEIYSVRYEAVNAMLLNEFLREHRRNEEQVATIARLEKQIEALTAGLQKVSAQLEVSKPAPQTVLNNQ